MNDRKHYLKAQDNLRDCERPATFYCSAPVPVSRGTLRSFVLCCHLVSSGPDTYRVEGQASHVHISFTVINIYGEIIEFLRGPGEGFGRDTREAALTEQQIQRQWFGWDMGQIGDNCCILLLAHNQLCWLAWTCREESICNRDSRQSAKHWQVTMSSRDNTPTYLRLFERSNRQ